MTAGTIQATTPFCRSCGWDYVRVETGADGVCDSCGDLLVNSEGNAPPPPVPATGAVAGAPGTWTPGGSVPPADFAAMAGITATPTSIWTVGQHMVLGDLSEAYWNGLAWTVGQSTGKATGATAGTPGSFTPGGSVTPVDLADMAGVVASPATLWTVGQSVQTADAADAYWDSGAWVLGVAPV